MSARPGRGIIVLALAVASSPPGTAPGAGAAGGGSTASLLFFSGCPAPAQFACADPPNASPLFRTELYSTPPVGGVARRITHNAAYEQFPLWSPDGRRMVFIVTEDGPLTCNLGELYAARGDGSDPERLDPRNCLHATDWSPDGRRILVEHAGACADIGWIDVVDGTRRWVTDCDPWEGPSDVSWAEDGQWIREGREIAFIGVTEEAGNGWLPAYDVYVEPAEGGERRPLAPDPLPARELAVAPDDTIIAFTDARDVFTVTIDGTERRKLTSFGSLDTKDLQWSPDGSWLLFRRVDRTGRSWLVRRDGSELREIPPLPGLETYSPVWSPDGTEIAFLASRCVSCHVLDSPSAVLVLDVDASTWRPLATDAPPYRLWGWVSVPAATG